MAAADNSRMSAALAVPPSSAAVNADMAAAYAAIDHVDRDRNGAEDRESA